MIATTWRYCRPSTLDAALDAWEDEQERGGKPAWYGGGTEVVTDARRFIKEPTAVIDIKEIPELRVLGRQDGMLWMGAALTLYELGAANLWPLLTETVGRIADHTGRVHITLGGNLAGRIAYREAGLPLLVWAEEARVRVAGPGGLRTVPLLDVFDGTPHLEHGELFTAVGVPEWVATRPGRAVKRTRLDWVDYPLVAAALTRDREGRYRLALSGVTAEPFRARRLEAALNRPGHSIQDRVKEAVAALPHSVVDDLHGTPAYRRFVLGYTLQDMLEDLEENGR
jgi:CO/xanthine dehydrogenase FAD-binding subunit